MIRMMPNVTFFFLFIPLLAWSQEECKDMDALAAREQAHAEAIASFRSSVFTGNYELVYHRLAWDIDPNELYISGLVTTYFEPKVADFQEIYFDFASNLTVNEVTYNGQPVNYEVLGNNSLRIDFPVPLPANTLDSVSIDYEGQPDATGFGSFVKSSHNGQPIIWTLSEPYGSKDWWPCKQDLIDKADSVDIIVTTPSAYRAASNGVLVSETEMNGYTSYHWKHRYPIPAYLIAVAVTNYAQYSDFVTVPNGDPIEVLNYVYPENLNNAQSKTGATVEIMELFNDIYELYPFADEKYGHAQCGFGGGMEHQTMSFMGGFSFGLQAHELAHQWFGDKITCGSWEDIWLNEGFATYSEGLTYNFGLGQQSWKGWLEDRVENITSAPGGSVKVTDTTSLGNIFSGRLSYSKGAMLLHMLRWKMGDADFFQAIQNYLNDPDLAFGYAKTPDLVAYLEAQSGMDLTEFMSDWYEGQGYPSYKVTWWKENDMVKLNVEQTTSHSSVDFFEMPIPIRFKGPDVDTVITFDHQFSGQEFEVALEGNVYDLDFDPDIWLISAGNQIVFNPSTALTAPWEETVVICPNPVKNKLEIHCLSNIYTPEMVEIIDASGRKVYAYPLLSNREALLVDFLPSGTYFLSIFTTKGVTGKKIIKQ